MLANFPALGMCTCTGIAIESWGVGDAVLGEAVDDRCGVGIVLRWAVRSGVVIHVWNLMNRLQRILVQIKALSYNMSCVNVLHVFSLLCSLFRESMYRSLKHHRISHI